MNNEIVKVINLGITEEKLNELKDKFSKVPDASTKEGYSLLKSSKSELTKYVTGVDKERKIQVRSALDHQKLVNTEAKRITGILEELRQPRIALIKLVDDEKKRIEEEKVNNELRRINRIKSEIAYIVDYKVKSIEMSTDELNQAIKEMEIARLRENGLDEFYDDFKAEAETTVSYLNKLHEQALKNEAYGQKMKEIKDAQDKIDAENKKIEEEKAKIAQEKRDEEVKRVADENAKIQIEEVKKQAEIDKVNAEKQRLIDIEKAEKQAEADIARAKKDERERLAKEARDKEIYEVEEKAKADEELKRKQENKAHIKKTDAEAIQSFIDEGETEHDAKQIVYTISKKLIKNITINY